jgi:hypothetical protein
LSELKTKFEESQKELASARVRMGLATREVNRQASSRSQPAPQTASRPPDPVPQPTPAPTRRAAEAGVYETIRATSVHEDPSGSSRVLSQIGPGTRINVVRSTGDWLEVRLNKAIRLDLFAWMMLNSSAEQISRRRLPILAPTSEVFPAYLLRSLRALFHREMKGHRRGALMKEFSLWKNRSHWKKMPRWRRLRAVSD